MFRSHFGSSSSGAKVHCIESQSTESNVRNITSRIPTIFCMSLFEQADRNGTLKFDYLHEGRAPATLWMSCKTRKLRYVGKSGLTADFHGEVTEKGRLGLFLADDKAYWNSDMLHPTEPHAEHGRKPTPALCHSLRIVDLHSFFGTPQPIIFYQRGAGCWRGTHRFGAEVYLVLRKKDFKNERQVCPLPRSIIILPGPPIPNGDETIANGNPHVPEYDDTIANDNDYEFLNGS